MSIGKFSAHITKNFSIAAAKNKVGEHCLHTKNSAQKFDIISVVYGGQWKDKTQHIVVNFIIAHLILWLQYFFQIF